MGWAWSIRWSIVGSQFSTESRIILQSLWIMEKVFSPILRKFSVFFFILVYSCIIMHIRVSCQTPDFFTLTFISIRVHSSITGRNLLKWPLIRTLHQLFLFWCLQDCNRTVEIFLWEMDILHSSQTIEEVRCPIFPQRTYRSIVHSTMML